MPELNYVTFEGYPCVYDPATARAWVMFVKPTWQPVHIADAYMKAGVKSAAEFAELFPKLPMPSAARHRRLVH